MFWKYKYKRKKEILFIGGRGGLSIVYVSEIVTLEIQYGGNDHMICLS
jgi:hypothetical protein